MVTKLIKIEESDYNELQKVMETEKLSSQVNAFHHVMMHYKLNVTGPTAVIDELKYTISLRENGISSLRLALDAAIKERDETRKQLNETVGSVGMSTERVAKRSGGKTSVSLTDEWTGKTVIITEKKSK